MDRQRTSPSGATGGRYERINLFVPALCRDALDRVAPLGNFVFLLAFLAYAGWLVLFVGFTIREIFTQRDVVAVIFSDKDWIPAAIATAMGGGLLVATGQFARIVSGLAISGYAISSLYSELGTSVSLVRGYADPNTSEFSVAGAPLLIVLDIAVFVIFLHILIAGVGLVIFGRKQFWPAFSVGSELLTLRGELLLRLGVADTGFYRGGKHRITMLLARISLALGMVASILGVMLAVATLARRRPLAPDLESALPTLTIAIGALIGIGLVSLAAAAVLGRMFRRWFPPQQIGGQHDVVGRPLFLRSFRDDNVRLRSARPLSLLPLPPDVPRNLDEIILARLPEHGGVRPGR